MVRPSIYLTLSFLSLGTLVAPGQEPTTTAPPPPPPATAPTAAPEPAPNVTEELRKIRLLLETQTKEIANLTAQVASLQRRMPPPAGSPPGPPPPAEENTPTPPPPAPAAEAPKAAEAGAPAAPAAAGGMKHTVAKGETLTSIAKHYKILVAELIKANAIRDERKIQIGQELNIPSPTPNAAPAPASADKKE